MGAPSTPQYVHLSEKEDRRKVPQGIADTAYQCGPSNRVGFVSGLDLFLAFAAKYIQGSIKNFKL
jgi:hypothetical protein